MKLVICLSIFVLAFQVRSASACELIDAATVQEVLGSEVVDVTSDPALNCMFVSSTTAAQFYAQTGTRDLYDQVTIPMPHKAEEIGERARSHEFPEGGAAVQFIAGDVSVTLGIRTPAGNDGRDYLPLLLDAAKAMAARLD